MARALTTILVVLLMCPALLPAHRSTAKYDSRRVEEARGEVWELEFLPYDCIEDDRRARQPR